MKFLSVSCLFLLTISWARPGLAFINIESLRQNLDKGFYGSTGLEAKGARGNTDVFNVGLNSQNIYKKDHREYLLIAKYKYGEGAGVKNRNQGDLHIRFADQVSNSLFWEVFAQLEFNEFQSLSLRSLGGGGLRARLVKTENSSLYLGIGLFYEDETVANDVDQANFRGNNYLSLRSLISKTAESVFILYYQPSLRDIRDWRFQFSAGLEVAVTESWNTVNRINYARDSRPPLGREKEDLSFVAGLNYKY